VTAGPSRRQELAAHRFPAESDRTDQPPRLRIYIEPRDAWIGAYIAEKAIYVCPVPFLVIRWDRHA
jgi:hypothetical protein